MHLDPCKTLLSSSARLGCNSGLFIEPSRPSFLTRLWRWLTGQYSLIKIEREIYRIASEVIKNQPTRSDTEIRTLVENYTLIIKKFKNPKNYMQIIKGANKKIQALKLKIVNPSDTGTADSLPKNPYTRVEERFSDDYFTVEQKKIKKLWTMYPLQLDTPVYEQPEFFLNKDRYTAHDLIKLLLGKGHSSIYIKEGHQIEAKDLLQMFNLQHPRDWIANEIPPTKEGLENYLSVKRDLLVAGIVGLDWFDTEGYYQELNPETPIPFSKPLSGSLISRMQSQSSSPSPNKDLTGE